MPTFALTFALAGVAQAPPAFAPLAWSPDGRELAFVGEAAEPDAVFPADWLFPAFAPVSKNLPTKRVLWVAAPRRGAIAATFSTEHALSAPAWAPDGSALYVVEFVAEPSTDPKTVPGRQRLWKIARTGETAAAVEEPAHALAARLTEFPLQAPAISPDGLFAAFPTLDPPGLAVATLVERRIVRRYAGALLPSWAPDGRHLLFFQPPQGASLFSLVGALAPKGSRATSLVAVDRGDFVNTNRAPTPISLGAFDPLRPVAWDRTGESFLAIRSTGLPASPFEQAKMGVYRCRRHEDRSVRVVDLVGGNTPNAMWPTFDYDRESESVVLAAPRGEGRYRLDRYAIATGKRVNGWHPLEDDQTAAAIPIGAPAISLDGAQTAFRFGAPERYAAVAVWDAEFDAARFVVGDDADALRAIGPLLAAARRTMKSVPPGNSVTLKMTLPESWARGRTPFNPFEWLPRANDKRGLREPAERAVRRLAASGLAAVASAETRPLSPTAQARLHEAAAYFHYLRNEYRPALDRLTQLERLRAPGPQARRVGLAVFRAQCLEGLGAVRFARLGLEAAVRSLPRPAAGSGEFALTPYDLEEAWKTWEEHLDPYETRLLEIYEPRIDDTEPISLPGYEVTVPSGK